MSKHLVPYQPLPCQAERKKIIDQAELVLNEARSITARCDHTYTLLPADGPPNTETLLRGLESRITHRDRMALN